jgi:hypothetical protein
MTKPRREVREHLSSPLIPCLCGCGELIHSIDYHGKPVLGYARGHKLKVNNPMKGLFGSDNPSWRGGRKKDKYGYWWLWTPKGYVQEHRLVWEKTHNACLLPWSNVHHKDGDKGNNFSHNLEAMMKGQHSRITNTGLIRSWATRTKISVNNYWTHWDSRYDS